MHAHGACQRRHCTIRAPLYERAYETEAAPGPLDAMQASPRAVGATEALAPASAEDHVHLTTRNGQVQAPTTWTILEQDGPNHLGLWYNA